MIARRTLIAGTAGLLAAPSIVRAQAANGVALVIGNSKYHWEATLPNVKRDAPDVARAFQSYGLKTELVQDAGRAAMNKALGSFAAAAKGAQFAAFYFAGHGASWGRDSYIVPVDSDLSDPKTVETLIKTQDVGGAMRGAANRLMVYDNCRNNPADGWRQKAAVDSSFVANSQLSAAAAVQGGNALVLFSTAPGRVALDGPPDANSPFAASLLRQFDEASVDLSALSSAVRRDLLIATEGRQVAWDQNTYGGPFLLKRTARPPSGSQGRPVAPAANRTFDLPKAYAYALGADYLEQDLVLSKDDVLVVQRGGRHPGYREEDGQRVMKRSEITVRVNLNRGSASATVWTCDLSHDYVSINADYRS